MNSVDRIFNERLDGHTSAPPKGAWDRVEMSLSRRPATSPLRWAAVLVPLVVAASWMLTRTDTAQVQVATQSSPVSSAPSSTVPIQKANVVTESVAIHRKSAQAVHDVTLLPEPSVETTATHPESTPMEEITIEPVELIAEVAEPAPSPAVEKPLVIVITLDPVAEAPDASRKPLTRVAEFAMAVKHSDPIASLRGVKDELLALDLRKKSTKKN